MAIPGACREDGRSGHECSARTAAAVAAAAAAAAAAVAETAAATAAVHSVTWRSEEPPLAPEPARAPPPPPDGGLLWLACMLDARDMLARNEWARSASTVGRAAGLDSRVCAGGGCRVCNEEQ